MSDNQRVPGKTDSRTEEASSHSLSEASVRQESGLSASQKIAIVHDWLNGMRGGEIVFEALVDLYPTADVFTLIYEPEKLHPRLQQKLRMRNVYTSWMNSFAITR